MPFQYELVELVLFSFLIKEEVRVWGVGMVERVKANWRKEKWASACFLCARVCRCQRINDDVSRCAPRLLGGAFFAQRVGHFQRFDETRGHRVGHVYSSVWRREKLGILAGMWRALMTSRANLMRMAACVTAEVKGDALIKGLCQSGSQPWVCEPFLCGEKLQ